MSASLYLSRKDFFSVFIKNLGNGLYSTVSQITEFSEPQESISNNAKQALEAIAFSMGFSPFLYEPEDKDNTLPDSKKPIDNSKIEKSIVWRK